MASASVSPEKRRRLHGLLDALLDEIQDGQSVGVLLLHETLLGERDRSLALSGLLGSDAVLLKDVRRYIRSK
jgi:hypothetical protein